MKRVNINAYQVGLLFRKGTYQRMLTKGGYWLWSDMQVFICERTQPLTAPVELNVLLEDPELSDALQVVTVRNNEIVLLYANGLLQEVLTTGRYAYWKHPVSYSFVRADLSKIDVTEQMSRMALQHPKPAQPGAFGVGFSYKTTFRAFLWEKVSISQDCGE